MLLRTANFSCANCKTPLAAGDYVVEWCLPTFEDPTFVHARCCQAFAVEKGITDQMAFSLAECQMTAPACFHMRINELIHKLLGEDPVQEHESTQVVASLHRLPRFEEVAEKEGDQEDGPPHAKKPKLAETGPGTCVKILDPHEPRPSSAADYEVFHLSTASEEMRTQFLNLPPPPDSQPLFIHGSSPRVFEDYQHQSRPEEEDSSWGTSELNLVWDMDSQPVMD